MAEFGLCKDEYTDTENWPPQLYVRESVRLQGEYIMTQRDVTKGGTVTKNDSVGLGDWEVDVHHVQRLAIRDPTNTSRWRTVDEGEVEGRTNGLMSLFKVPFRSLLPKSGEAANLLVPVCISSSHIGFAAYRYVCR